MITSLPWPLDVAIGFALGAFLVWVGYRLGSAERRVDRILDEQTDRRRLNNQEASDRADREGSDG